MKPIDAASFNKALSILSQTFQENPSVLSVVKKDDKESQRIAALCKYCIRISIEKQGAFISSCEKGVALAYDSRKKISAWKSLLNYIRLGQYCIGWDRAFTIIRRDIEIHRRRGNEPHLYFWMLAVEDHTHGVNTIIEMREYVYGLSKQLNLPILAETSTLRTLNMYIRYGFHVYDEWDTGMDGVILYFIRRFPEN